MDPAVRGTQRRGPHARPVGTAAHPWTPPPASWTAPPPSLRGPQSGRRHPGSLPLPTESEPPPSLTPRTRDPVLGFRGKFLEQVLAAGDRGAMQASDTARKKPRPAAAEYHPEPRRVSPQPAGRHPHSPRESPGAELREAPRRGAGRRAATRGGATCSGAGPRGRIGGT